ncbi:alcohol dehydrogenase GroES-like domain-containing protein [Xylaria bambusicola]|uniref:alcohol dehydrogenase GroES-like domain-containing protein n=1 Tax=Xylaria bambusicola TaxID=326684 RepID=UPI002007EB40|nr:alcohol dehydrogenase GroES-like domain-containing protein [Xylaria bambusicola]KAI0503220.1 alcohol dehydrogenase GroES-like domain-containing protein [Xylaria bambusicola]
MCGTIQVNASVLHGAKDLRIEQRTLSAPSDSEVQVAVSATGLCGSDLHYFNHFRNGNIQVVQPLSLGHESAGTITAVGPDVTDLKVGDRVALEVGLPCEKCELCAAGRYNICKAMSFRSSAKSVPHFQGTLQTRINHPARYCHKLPPSLTLEHGALIEPLSVAMHAGKRSGIAQGSTIVILGAGAVGLLCGAVAKVAGAKKIVIADILAERTTFAVDNGFADAAFTVPLARPQTIEEKLVYAQDVAEKIKRVNINGEEVGEVDVTFECTGVESCMHSAIYSTKPGGKVMIIGMGTPIQTIPISAAALREVDLVGVFRYANTYPAAMKVLSEKNERLPDISKLVTQRFQGLDSIPAAFEMAGKVKDEHGNLVLKVMVDTGDALQQAAL